MADTTDHVPATAIERSARMAQAGLKVGGNYAKYLARKAVGRSSEADKAVLHRNNAEALYQEFAQLRGTALKLAQSISVDPGGFIPEAFAEVLSQAQYRVPPMSVALVSRRIKDELGASPEDLFASFDRDALAAASIGQVHRATLRDGTPVAVKVQYPGVRETISSDLAVAKTVMRRIVKSGKVPLDHYIQEVRDRLLEETDYEQEARNIECIAKQYQHPRIVTPRVMADYTTKGVLTMSFVEGQHLAEFLADQPSKARKDDAGQLLWDFVHDQVAGGYDTMHADVHPGNFLFRQDGTLGVVDFGCVKSFPPSFRSQFLALFRAQIREDWDEAKALYYETDILNPESQDAQSQERIFDFFKRFGQHLLAPYKSPTFDFSNRPFHDQLGKLFKEASTFNEPIGSPHFIFVNKVLVGLHGVLARLGPTIDTRASLDQLMQAQ